MDSEQTQSAGILAVLTWWEVNKKTVVKIAVAVLAIAVAWYTWSYFKKTKEMEASGALLSLIRPPDAGGRPTPPTAGEYLKVADQFPGTPTAERAEILAAGSLYADKKYPEARQKFEAFVAAHSEGELAEIAEFGIASCLNAANDVDKAIAAYQQFISRHGSSIMANQARLELGLLLESKKQPEQALKLYEQVLRDKDESIWARGAEMRQDQLFEKYPNLAPKPPAAPVSTNAPASVTVTPVPQPKSAPAAMTNASPAKK